MREGTETFRGDRLLAWIATGLAVLLGGSVALACGCGGDGLAALAAGGLAMSGHFVLRWRRKAGLMSAPGLQDRADIAIMLLGGGGVLLAARCGPGLAGVGALALALCWQSLYRATPGSATAAWIAGACTWLVVVGVDQAHRHSLSTMAAIVGTGPALLVVAARLPSRHRGSAALLSLAGHGWTALWWWIQWLPTSAWWALASAGFAVLGLISGKGGCTTPGGRLRWWTALLHAGLLVASLWSVVALR